MVIVALVLAPSSLSGGGGPRTIVDRVLGWLLAVPLAITSEAPLVLVAWWIVRPSKMWIVVAIHAALFGLMSGHAIVEAVDIQLDESKPEAQEVRIESFDRPRRGMSSVDVRRISDNERWTLLPSYAPYGSSEGTVVEVHLHRGAIGVRWVEP
jgi:hypothetical protein